MVAIEGLDLWPGAGNARGCALAVTLARPPQRSRTFAFTGAGWEVETRQGIGRAVARSADGMERAALLDAGIDAIHRALDLASVEDGDHLATVAPADEHIGLTLEHGQVVVWHRSVAEMVAGAEASIRGIRSDGTVVPDPPRVELGWTPAFRFYRLAQGSRDLFEAYRNMFLALEALLSSRVQRRRDERGGLEKEKDWLLRALNVAGTETDLRALVGPRSTDPAKELCNRVYEVRRQLFHAKAGQALIPHDRASYLAVAQAYPMLVSLWLSVATAWLPLEQRGGGLAYPGFKKVFEGAFYGARMSLTADTTPFSENDESISPKGLSRHDFPDATAISEGRKGLMELRGRVQTALLPSAQIVGRVAALIDGGRPVLVAPIGGG